MSAKATGLVWDLECPRDVNGIPFRPSHKFTLVAYADHADHNGRNIWPAIPTIARKTGYEPRSITRLTNDLEEMGYLIADGQGPRGTNKWRLPYNDRGDGLSPRRPVRSDPGAKSLDDRALDDSTLDDSVSGEGTELELSINTIPEQKYWELVQETLKEEMPAAAYDTYVRNSWAIRYDRNAQILTIGVRTTSTRDWMDSRVRMAAERYLVGIMKTSVGIDFVVLEVQP